MFNSFDNRDTMDSSDINTSQPLDRKNVSKKVHD